MPDDLRRRYASAVLSDFYEPHEIKESAHYGGSVFAAVDRILAVRDEELAALRERAETAEEALYSSRLAVDRVVALARSLAATNPETAALIAETVVNMPEECAPGAALALLDPPPEPR